MSYVVYLGSQNPPCFLQPHVPSSHILKYRHCTLCWHCIEVYSLYQMSRLDWTYCFVTHPVQLAKEDLHLLGETTQCLQQVWLLMRCKLTLKIHPLSSSPLKHWLSLLQLFQESKLRLGKTGKLNGLLLPESMS